MELNAANRSALATYCRKCFFVNVAANRRQLKKPPQDAEHCILCSVELSSDNKSPTPACCHACWESQEAIAEALQAQVAASDVSEAAKPVSQQVEPSVASDITDGSSFNWARQTRESETVWHARVQGFLDGPDCKKQKDYIETWKKFTQEEKEAFRAMVKSKCSKETSANALSDAGPKMTGKPWYAMSGELRTICLPENYTVDRLRSDFAKFAESAAAIASNDQARWEMYCLIFLLLRKPDSGLANAAAAERELGDLHVNRKRLYQMAKNYEEPLPRDCPCEFKIGRTPDTSLSHQEKEDILLFVKYHERTGTALSVEQVEQAIAAKLDYLNLVCFFFCLGYPVSIHLTANSRGRNHQ